MDERSKVGQAYAASGFLLLFPVLPFGYWRETFNLTLYVTLILILYPIPRYEGNYEDAIGHIRFGSKKKVDYFYFNSGAVL